MTYPPTVASEFPFTTLLRATDRERLLVPLVAAVWNSILGLPLLHRDGPEALDGGPTPEPVLLGVVSIAGAWEGTVAMTCPPAHASGAVARMHGRDPAALTPAEVTDGWGELVNMVGGSLKGMLPPPSCLSLPVVREHPTYSYREEGTRVINELTFACLGRRLRLAVAHRGA